MDDLIQIQPELRRILDGDEDSLQELNLGLLQNRRTIRDLARYARRAARNSRNRSRMERRQCPLVSLDERFCIPDARPSPAEVASKHEETALLDLAISQLPPAQRMAIEARLASDMDTPPCRSSAFNSARYKALRNLRKRLASSARRDEQIDARAVKKTRKPLERRS
jgi:DNA-directed RNA polymerase specialized sigma24 family protein